MKIVLPLLLLMLFALPIAGQETLEKEVLKTAGGDIEITFVGHGSLMLKYGGKIVHIDPFSMLTDYTKLPKADLLLLTHEHPDHLDSAALTQLRTKDTSVVLSEKCAEKVNGGVIMKNGDIRTVLGIRI